MMLKEFVNQNGEVYNDISDVVRIDSDYDYPIEIDWVNNLSITFTIRPNAILSKALDANRVREEKKPLFNGGWDVIDDSAWYEYRLTVRENKESELTIWVAGISEDTDFMNFQFTDEEKEQIWNLTDKYCMYFYQTELQKLFDDEHENIRGFQEKE